MKTAINTIQTEPTPGPWTMDGEDGIWFVSASPNCIAECSERDGSSEANARLIAAAPDLLSACKLSLSEFERFYNDQPRAMFNHNPAVKAIRKAIAKAEGAK